MKHKTKNIGVRLTDAELLTLSSIPAENYPSAIRYLIRYWAEREQQQEQLQQIGDRIIASLSTRIDSLSLQSQNAISVESIIESIQETIRAIPRQNPDVTGDSILRKGLAETIKHGLIPLAQMDRRGPLMTVAEMLEKAEKAAR